MTMRPEDLHDMTRGYITAALWADAQPLCTCGAHDSVDECDHAYPCRAEESGGLEHLTVHPEDYVFVRQLCERFVKAAQADLETFAKLRSFDPAEGSVWSYIGHDLRLTSVGHGTGFWDREPDPDRAPSGTSVQRWQDMTDRFLDARDRLTALSGTAPFGLAEHYGVWQESEDIVTFDWFSLEPGAAPGERWEAPELTSAQRQAWMETGEVPPVQETFPVADAYPGEVFPGLYDSLLTAAGYPEDSDDED